MEAIDTGHPFRERPTDTRHGRDSMNRNITMTTAAIYVPAAAGDNLDIGVRRGIWGLRRETATMAPVVPNVRALQPGVLQVLAHRGPSSRVAAGGWATATFGRVVLGEITTAVDHDAQGAVWPDEHYEVRWGFEVLEVMQDVPGASLGSDIAEALRLSANVRGAPYVTGQDPHSGVIDFADTPAPSFDDRLLDLDGATDGVRRQVQRREQSRLRRLRLAGRSVAACDLCQVDVTVNKLRLAHIKRRSACSRDQRLDIHNTMLACTLNGCDDLFEHGDLGVGDDGRILTRPNGLTAAMRDRLATLHGRPFGGFAAAEPYVAWHRTHVLRGA